LGPRTMRMGSEEGSTMRNVIVPNIVRVIKYVRIRWAGYVAIIEEGRSSFRILIGKPTKRRPSGRPRRGWKGNIRMDLNEIGINTRNWADSTQGEIIGEL
jgi:hypothetical protein